MRALPRFRLRPGFATPHCFKDVDDSPAHVVVMFTPAGMERFFDRFAALPVPDPGAFGRIGGQLGMEVVGPPLAQSDPLQPRS